ncbi:MAG: pitrilysin family protein [Thermodesulfobacteriota bacterium]|nr:pitrilysin family protein [Thermodesulfobacteriota bacterium]
MFNKTDLDNGLRFVTERMPHVKSVSVGIWVNVGSRDERQGESGISHLIEHMIFKGTARRTARQIATEIDQVGGMSNAFTSKEFTCFHAKVMSDHLPLVTDLLTDIFLNSLFGLDDLERERQVILQEISMIEDTPDELVHVLFCRNLWPEAPLGRPVMGTIETVSGFGRDEIQGYLERNYVPPKIVIAATGDVEHQAFVDLMGPAFESLSRAKSGMASSAPQVNTGVNVISRNLEQAHICLGSRFPSALDERRYAAALLNIILGGNMSSRLFQEIRENRGLAYSVYSFISAYIDTGLLGVYAGVEPGKTLETTQLILAELAKLREGVLTETELKAAREHLKGGIVLGSESTDNRMIRLAKNEITYQRYIEFDEILDAVSKVGPDQIVALARDFLESENLSLTVLGSVDETDLPAGLLNS